MRKVYLAVLATGLVVGCSDLSSPGVTKPHAVADLTALGPSVVLWDPRSVHPTLPIYALDDGAGDDTTDPIVYHGGTMITTPKVAVIYWANRRLYNGGPAPGDTGVGGADGSLIGYFLNNLGGSAWWNILTTYYNGAGTHIQNTLTYTRYWATTDDAPAPGDTVDNGAIIGAVLEYGFEHGYLIYDPSTTYAFLVDSGVNVLANNRIACGYHSFVAYSGGAYSGDTVKYAALSRAYDVTANGGCGIPQNASPNSDTASDWEVSLVAHELAEVSTNWNTFFNPAWHDTVDQEIGDKCIYKYGVTYPVNGANANVHLGAPRPGGKDFLIQRLWKNVTPQQCALFSLTMSGPTAITTSGTYTWTANPAGSPSGYTYRWWYRNQGSSTWNALDTTQSQSRPVSLGDPNFTILDSATNVFGQTQVVTLFVTVAPVLSVSISGPTLVWEGAPCTWHGSVTGGTPSYIYEWDVYGDAATNPVRVDTTTSTSDSLIYQVREVGDTFTIALTVTDAGHNSASNSLAVWSAGYGCGY